MKLAQTGKSLVRLMGAFPWPRTRVSQYGIDGSRARCLNFNPDKEL
jgi:hypothetical protein